MVMSIKALGSGVRDRERFARDGVEHGDGLDVVPRDLRGAAVVEVQDVGEVGSPFLHFFGRAAVGQGQLHEQVAGELLGSVLDQLEVITLGFHQAPPVMKLLGARSMGVSWGPVAWYDLIAGGARSEEHTSD